MRRGLIVVAIVSMVIVCPMSVIAQMLTDSVDSIHWSATWNDPSARAAEKKSYHRYDYECRSGKVKAFRCAKDDNQDECETARSKVKDICAHPEWVKKRGFDYDPCLNPNAINPFEIVCR
jgi:hypothetical protein